MKVKTEAIKPCGERRVPQTHVLRVCGGTPSQSFRVSLENPCFSQSLAVLPAWGLYFAKSLNYAVSLIKAVKTELTMIRNTGLRNTNTWSAERTQKAQEGIFRGRMRTGKEHTKKLTGEL